MGKGNAAEEYPSDAQRYPAYLEFIPQEYAAGDGQSKHKDRVRNTRTEKQTIKPIHKLLEKMLLQREEQYTFFKTEYKGTAFI